MCPPKKYPALKSIRRDPKKQFCESITVDDSRTSTLTSSHHGTPPSPVRFESLQDEMLTFTAYPVFQNKKAPRPCAYRSYPRSQLWENELLTLFSSRCPPVRGTLRQQSDRQLHRIKHIDNILQSCRQAQKAPGWSWYGRWSGTTATLENLKIGNQSIALTRRKAPSPYQPR